MVSIKQKKIGIEFCFISMAVILGILILIVSLTRTSLIGILKDEKENKLRTEPVEFLVQNKDGILEKSSYKLPQTNLLPDDFFYFLKEIRESLWIKLSHNSYDKSRILFLIADKKASETKLLIENKKIEMALNTIQKAINQLKYSRKEIKNFQNNQNNISQLNEQFFQASLAYQKILDCNQEIFSDTKKEKCQRIINDFNNWIKKEKEEETEKENK